jgi:thioredoxin-related protein
MTDAALKRRFVNTLRPMIYKLSMKQTLFIISIFLMAVSCKRDQEILVSQDYKAVFELAPKTGKKIIIDFYTQWCGTCKSYDKHIFPDSAFQNYIKSKFYFLKLDAELPENIEISKRYKIYGYPAIVVADSAGNEINRINGYSSNDPKYYVDLIESILQGKENYESYERQFLSHPDSMEIVREIMGKLFSQDDFKHVREFNELVIKHAKNKEIIFESNIYKGLADARDINVKSTATLRAILENNSNLSASFEEGILCELNKFYVAQPDSFEYYGFELLKKYPNGTYSTNRDFIEYLFLNNKKVEQACKFAEYYNAKNSDDHWAAYLIALSCASKNDVEGGADYFESWLKNHESTIDGNWPYFFYVKYAALNKTRIDKAIDYAYKIENGSCDRVEIRINLAKLLHEKGENSKAISKLREVIPIINSLEEKKKIDSLIKEYSI